MPLYIDAQPVRILREPDSVLGTPGISVVEPAFACGGGEIMPESQFNLNQYLATHVHYAKDAKEKGIEGKVMVKFLVTPGGQIDSVTIARALYPSLDSEAVRVIKAMPRWKPARQNGKTVKCYYTLPVLFKLE